VAMAAAMWGGITATPAPTNATSPVQAMLQALGTPYAGGFAGRPERFSASGPIASMSGRPWR
jgi:hypothetical protein